MNKQLLAYGAVFGLSLVLLKWLDYHFFIREISLEIYIVVIATICAGLGIWMGLRFRKTQVVIKATSPQIEIDQAKVSELGISPREIEVLELMANGHSNQEIAEQLYISLNTVKTHTSSIFSKLDAKRRVQAVKKAREMQLIT